MRPFKSKYFGKWNHWLIHAPKTFTAARNMRSPGYALVLQWISEAWADIDPNLIARSFDHCEITSSRLIDFNNQLRHFVRTTELVDEIQPEEPSDNQGVNVFENEGDDWDAQTQAILDSDSDNDNEEDEH